MRKLVIFLVIVVAAGGVGDVAARQWAEGQIETRANAELPDQTSTVAHVRGFPFLLPLFLSGKVSEADGHFENVPAAPLTLSVVDIELHGVKVDRHELLNNRRVQLVSIDSGTVSIEISAAVLAKAIGVPVSIANGALRAASSIAKLRVENNALIVDIAGVTRRVPIPKTRLVPCASNVTILAGRVRLSCTIDHVPPAMLGAANRAVG